MVVSIQVPDWMPPEPWLAMVAMRERMHPKVQWSEDAAKGIVSKITRLRSEGHCPARLLEKAVVSGWRTVFEADDTLATTPRAAQPFDKSEYEQRLAKIGRNDSTGPPRPIGDVVKRMNIGG